MEQQVPKQHKEMYVLSLDNARIIWVLSITLLVVVFLFLLGYWIGRDTTGNPGIPADNYLSRAKDSNLPGAGRQDLDGLQKKMAMMANPSSQTNYASMTTAVRADDLKTRLQGQLKTPLEQKEFESLRGKKPVYTERQTKHVTTGKGAAPQARRTPVVKTAARSKNTGSASKGTSKVYVPTGKYAIQVASLSQSGSAHQLRNRLSRQHFRSFVSSALVNGKKYYRIKVGRFRNYQSAQQILAKLKATSFGKNSFIVTN